MGIAQLELHARLVQSPECFEQITDVEPDRDVADLGVRLDFLEGFLLLGIMGDDAGSPG